jgi:hypothetical protein
VPPRFPSTASTAQQQAASRQQKHECAAAMGHHHTRARRALQYSAWTTHRCRPAAFAGKYHRGRQKSSLLLRYFPTEHRHTSAIKTDEVAAAPHFPEPGHSTLGEARRHRLSTNGVALAAATDVAVSYKDDVGQGTPERSHPEPLQRWDSTPRRSHATGAASGPRRRPPHWSRTSVEPLPL